MARSNRRFPLLLRLFAIILSCALPHGAFVHSRKAAEAPSSVIFAKPSMVSSAAFITSDKGVEWAPLLLDSYEKTVGTPLIKRKGDVYKQAEDLFNAPRVVVSHNTAEDPILNYGNAMALRLWEMDQKTFIKTPSRQTAEPVAREARLRLLDQVRTKGYIDNYSGVRISSIGKRFIIQKAIIWELYDKDVVQRDQAATFGSWKDA